VEILREGAIPEARIRQPGQQTILFVCRGNTDRSPLAAAILRRRLSVALGCPEGDLESRGFRVFSAGVEAREGEGPSASVRKIAREWPDGALDLAGHVSRKLTADLVNEATRVFCMEREHRDQILAFFSHREGDVFLVDPEGGDVADPAGQPFAAFKKLASRLDAAAALIAGTLARSPGA
jgi:protein-tyrosine phosphatase